jgi:hypothetical protein
MGETEEVSMASEIDPESLPAHQFNWFKYLIDTELRHSDEEGNVSALHTADSYISLLNIVTSSKTDEEIQEELLDLVGFHNFPLLEKLLTKRDAIKIYTSAIRESLKDDRSAPQRRPQERKESKRQLYSLVRELEGNQL